MRELSTEVSVRTIALRDPINTAHGPISERRLIQLRLTDGTHEGWGEAAPLPGFGLETHAEALEALRAWKPGGEIPRAPAAAGAAATAMQNLSSAQADSTLGRDLAGLAAGRPLRVQSLVGAPDPLQTAMQARRADELGHHGVKVKVGVDELDVARVRAVRAPLPKLTIRIDANQGWSVEQAVDALKALEPMDLDLVEEPCATLDEIAKVWEATGAPIAIDEHANDPASIDAVIGAPWLDAVVLKPAILGGPVATIDLGRRIIAAGHRVIVSSFIDSEIGLRAAGAVARALAPDELHGLGTADLFVAPLPPDVMPNRGSINPL